MIALMKRKNDNINNINKNDLIKKINKIKTETVTPIINTIA